MHERQAGGRSATGHFATLWGLAKHVWSTLVNGRFLPAAPKASAVRPITAASPRPSNRRKCANQRHDQIYSGRTAVRTYWTLQKRSRDLALRVSKTLLRQQIIAPCSRLR